MGSSQRQRMRATLLDMTVAMIAGVTVAMYSITRPVPRFGF